MILVAIFLVNAALSFALSLVLASLLGPDGFGRYAIGLAVTLVINTVLFEWLRLSTTRFYSERVRQVEPGVRQTLDRLYLLSGAGLAAATAAALGLAADLGVPASLLAAAAACGLAYGFCEYRMALARARFLEGPYGLLGLLRALFGFLFAAGAALLTRDPALVLGGAALAALLPILFVTRRLRDPGAAPAGIRRDLLRRFARYGLPLVAATACYQLLPLLNRSLLAGRDGFAEAGYFSLASELATRLFQNLGAALDLVLFQLAVRAEELHGREAGDAQVARNAAVVGAIVLPSAAGLWAVWPSFEALFIPAAFQGRLSDTMGLMIPTLAAFALVQYALNPVFQLRHRTAPVIAAAAAAVLVNVAAVLAWPGLGGAQGFAAAQLAGMACGLAVLCGMAVAAGARLPWRDLALSGLLTAVMAAALWPTRGWALPPAALLPVQVALGGGLYGALALACDLAGLRRAITTRLSRPACPAA
ncbi:lipopolysaccharide biosynthesis protein [Enterovirga sp.]|uniref:lipopolysaccharide biosynthesis protein n=1 Tax=Enterovirga sp. TaxID=2026350 RepID=UPI00262ECFA4|nr:lipopolysaccharide biosynthesis protein [Enterovirga sp.]MDB5591321.1 teichoic acid transporter [Enterovirga sp.]